MNSLPEEFLRGVELFNDSKYFECHEAWEIVWLKSDGDEREFLHAMIQAAAALHHAQRGNWKGATSVGNRAIGKLATMPLVMMQISTTKFRRSLQRFLATSGALLPRVNLLGEDL